MHTIQMNGAFKQEVFQPLPILFQGYLSHVLQGHTQAPSLRVINRSQQLSDVILQIIKHFRVLSVLHTNDSISLNFFLQPHDLFEGGLQISLKLDVLIYDITDLELVILGLMVFYYVFIVIIGVAEHRLLVLVKQGRGLLILHRLFLKGTLIAHDLHLAYLKLIFLLVKLLLHDFLALLHGSHGLLLLGAQVGHYLLRDQHPSLHLISGERHHC
jgi:hypothetical protein